MAAVCDVSHSQQKWRPKICFLKLTRNWWKASRSLARLSSDNISLKSNRRTFTAYKKIRKDPFDIPTESRVSSDSIVKTFVIESRVKQRNLFVSFFEVKHYINKIL